MKKKKLWKDIKKCFLNSKGRFISIFCLMMLGSFALVGLKVTGPDMRETGLHYFEDLNLSDITVIGDYGIDENNQATINQLSGTSKIEYGYLKDVEIRDTTDSIRLFSNPDTISKYELTAGKHAEKDDEIVLSDTYKSQYHIGDTLKVTEKESAGTKVLKKHTFKIVGFAKSPEFLSSINMGQSTSGTGELKGYGFVKKDVFDSDFYMIARMTFRDTQNVNPYSDTYTDLIQTHKNQLDKLLESQPALRLETLKDTYQSNIDDGQKQIDEAKQKLSDTKEQLADADKQIEDAKTAIASSDSQLKAAKEQLASGKATLTEKWKQLQSAKQSLDSAKNTLQTTENQLSSAYSSLQDGWSKINTADSQLSEKETQLAQAKETLASSEQAFSSKSAEFQEKQQTYQSAFDEFTQKQLAYQSASDELAAQQNALDSNKNTLISAKQEYETSIDSCTQTVNALKEQLANPDLSQEEQEALHQKLAAAQAELEQCQSEYESFLSGTYTPQMDSLAAMQTQLDQKKAELEQSKTLLAEKETELKNAKQQLDSSEQEIGAASAQLTDAKNQIAANEAQLSEARQSLAEQKALLETKQEEYNSGYAQYQSGVSLYNQNLNTYYSGLSAWKESFETLHSKEKEYQENVDKLEAAKQELSDKEAEYESGLKEFTTKEADANKEIAENEEKLADAKEEMDSLELPVYTLSTRREAAGSDGYKIYDSISTIIDALANVFPIFLYFVAALVTLTTMTRFVDEERMNAGTLKALGYTDRDVMKKFTVYGLIAGVSGTLAGILSGHLLLPEIIYNAYGNSFDVPVIEKHFYLSTSLVALVLSVFSAVLPACIVALRELKEKPAALLLPKAPTKGSKIFLEHLTPIWNRMSFTHKVTARNIFRYKKRMFMTIFGVCGAVALLFTGLSVQNSISKINDRQFGELIQYDLIVAQNSHLTDNEQQELDSLLNGSSIKEQLPVHYESVTKVAGKKKDKQEITMIVTQNEQKFRDYFTLVHREDNTQIALDDNGVVISERLAKLLDVKAGDSFTITDSNDKEHKVKVASITEMYTGHFMFMNDNYYETAFSDTYQANANLVSLKDSSLENAQTQASHFMESDAVKGVVQNTTMINQINTIVDSLNQIMQVLILVAVLLGIVILYNLTNINVAERIRELSTIKVLGFYDKEVTLYIYRETILLSLLGILTGFGVGDLLYRYILAVVPPDEVMFNPALSARAFLLPAVLIAAITFVLGYMMNRKLKYLDMLSALKSVE